MPEQSSLDRLLSAQGCQGMDNLISEVCNKCSVSDRDSCKQKGVKCRAKVILLSMAVKFSSQHEAGQADIHPFFNIFKDVIKE